MESSVDLAHLLRSLEEDLLRPEVRHSVSALMELLAEDFVEIGSSGDVYDRGRIIAELADEQAVKITLSDFGLRQLADDVALVTYRATIHHEDRPGPGESWRSSLWVFREGRWRMVFHQGTPTAEE